MKKQLRIAMILLIVFMISCNKDNEINQPLTNSSNTLTASMPLNEFQHYRYYLVDNDSRSLQFVFSDSLNGADASSFITLSDNTGDLGDKVDMIIDGPLLTIDLHDDMVLNGGWCYYLTLVQGMQSLSGQMIVADTVLEIRTDSKTLEEMDAGGKAGDGVSTDRGRNLIAVISDIHMGDKRATDGHHSWFDQNAPALTAYLQYIRGNDNIRQLVIQGDLMDEWLVPWWEKPFDTAMGINNSDDYFRAIAANPMNVPIINELKGIITDGNIDVIYIPGNHDMLLTESILQEIIPGIQWKGDQAGLGSYHPVDEILMEHGHRYDFFNCPQPLVTPGHMLPPGYFVTRMQASAMTVMADSSKAMDNTKSTITFRTAWTLALAYIMASADMDVDTVHMDSAVIQMTGIDGFTAMTSFYGEEERYAANIEDLWSQTQTNNGVPHPMSAFFAIAGDAYLYGDAIYEYLSAYFSDQPKMVSWGHSHEPQIKAFPTDLLYTGIYANSGSWVDDDQCSHKTRTFLIITPGDWSGSDLDVVSLYQYNADGSGYSSDRISEKSIKRH